MQSLSIQGMARFLFIPGCWGTAVGDTHKCLYLGESTTHLQWTTCNVWEMKLQSLPALIRLRMTVVAMKEQELYAEVFNKHLNHNTQMARRKNEIPFSDPVSCDNDGDCPQDSFCGDNWNTFFCDAHPTTKYCSPGV